MNVIQMSHFRELPGAPVIVLADLQREYIAAGRAYAIASLEDCLGRCKAILDEARMMGLPIAHFRQLRASSFFNHASPFSKWIEDFQPRCNEMVFSRTMPSCYSNSGFCNFLERIEAPTIVLAGLTGEEACLSTAIDALHKNHKLIFVKDASASRAIGNLDEAETHELLSKIISHYAETVNSSELLCQLKWSLSRAS